MRALAIGTLSIAGLVLASNSWSAEKPARDLAIYPAVEEDAVLESATTTMNKAKECVQNGRLVMQPYTTTAGASYFLPGTIDGVEPQIVSRTAQYNCRATPLHTCRFVYAWDVAGSDLQYASIDCTGSFDSPDERYSVSATYDLKGARSKKKKVGSERFSMTFFTTGFPGTNAWVFAARDRRTGESKDGTLLRVFNDYANESSHAGAGTTPEELAAGVSRLHKLTCEVVQADPCVPAVATAQ